MIHCLQVCIVHVFELRLWERWAEMVALCKLFTKLKAFPEEKTNLICEVDLLLPVGFLLDLPLQSQELHGLDHSLTANRCSPSLGKKQTHSRS